MSAPNIVGITSIIGISTGISLTTTPQVFLSNPSNSNSVYKINNVIISNIDGTSAANLYLKMHFQGAAGAGSSISLVHELSVLADSATIVIDKASSVYLQENQSLVAYASAAGDLDLVCSYETIK
jgi:hypothetical protein